MVDSTTHTTISIGDKPLLTLFDADARVEQTEREDLAIANSERISAAISDYRRERTPEVLRQQAVEALAAIAALALAVAMVIWLTRRLHVLLAKRLRSRIGDLEIHSFEIVRAERIWAALRAAVSTLRFVAILIASVTCLDFVLGGFPWTRGFARGLTEVLVRPLKIMGEALVAYFPDLVFLVVLALVVRFILRLIRVFFDAAARGEVTMEDFETESAGPTYKIVRVAVLIFAVIVAYRYIPGSDSDAFKGISLLVGVVVSLGSSSAIANLVAGLMITYRRAFKLGDRVKIGDVTVDVTDIHAQVTHLRTLKNEEVTIANSQILNGHVVNYSSLAKENGLIVHSKVGIGYETPWRQVEAMLLMAVARTPGLLAVPAPFVLYGELGDFCVCYEINAYCSDAHAMQRLHAQLQRSILDVFNEYGVQIMTPSYETDPQQPKLSKEASGMLHQRCPSRLTTRRESEPLRLRPAGWRGVPGRRAAARRSRPVRLAKLCVWPRVAGHRREVAAMKIRHHPAARAVLCVLACLLASAGVAAPVTTITPDPVLSPDAVAPDPALAPEQINPPPALSPYAVRPDPALAPEQDQGPPVRSPEAVAPDPALSPEQITAPPALSPD